MALRLHNLLNPRSELFKCHLAQISHLRVATSCVVTKTFMLLSSCFAA